MTRCKLLKVPCHAFIRCIDFKGIDEKNRTHLRFETRHTLSSMSHKPNLLSWDQDVAASPHEFHETDSNGTNSAALLATFHFFSSTFLFVISGFQNFYPPKNYRKLLFLFFQMLCHSSKAKEVSRSPENYHLLQK